MPLPIIVSISRHVRGLETLSHFLHSRLAVCLGCASWGVDTVAPVSLLDGGEVDPDQDAAAYLCERCSMALPTQKEIVRSEWPALTALEVQRVWAWVRHEQKRDLAAQAARETAVPCGIDELTKTLAASLQKARADQGVNRIGKVS